MDLTADAAVPGADLAVGTSGMRFLRLNDRGFDLVMDRIAWPLEDGRLRWQPSRLTSRGNEPTGLQT